MNFRSLIMATSFGFCALLLGSPPALLGLMVFGTSTANAADCADTAALVAGGSSGAVCSSAAFTSGANSTINGKLSAKAAVTLGATSRVNGSVSAGADFTSGNGSVVNGNVNAAGDITLGANSRITGTVHSGTGVINRGAGATTGKVVK